MYCLTDISMHQRGIKMGISKNTTCPFCKIPLREYHDHVTCSTCETSYHKKCWEDNGGCALCNVIPGTPGDTPDKSANWYLYHNNKNLGPLTWEQLCSHPGIQPGDLVWNNRLPGWIRADQLPDLPSGGPSGMPAVEAEERLGTDKDTAFPETGERPAAAPAPSSGSTQWRSGGAGYRFSPKPAREPEHRDTGKDAALPATGERPAAVPAPSGGSPQWRLGGAGQKGEMPTGEQPSPWSETQIRASFQNEHILDQLYADETSGPLASYGYLESRNYYDEQAELARKYSRQMLFGILWVLGGLLVTAGTFFSAVNRGTGYYIITWGAIIYGALEFFYGLVGWLKYRL